MALLQYVTLGLLIVSLAIGFRRRLYRGTFFPLYAWMIHGVTFYVAVVFADFCEAASVLPFHEWSSALRLHLAITLLGYVLIYKDDGNE